MQLSSKIIVGKYNILKIDRETSSGYFLKAEDGEEVLLPGQYIREDMKVGNFVKVFIYTDSEDRLIATTIQPKVKVGEFGFLEVREITNFGAFVDIGLPKDILVPKKMQKGEMKIGQKYIFALTTDIKTNRLIADMRIHRYLDKEPSHAKHLKEVSLLVIAKTPMGYKVIANNSFEGMIYKNEIYHEVRVGQTLTGYVKKVREDGKLDISINPIGKNKADTNSQKVIEVLKNSGYKLPFTYKSNAEDIKKVFGMSKKAFKASLTKLLETNQIKLYEKGIELK